MNDITQARAQQIFDLDSYKEVTGAKRFKRTKEEMALGLSPDEALQRRLDPFRGQELPSGAVGSTDTAVGQKPKVRASTSRKGDIVLRIRPAVGVDSAYFERIPQDGRDREIILDEKWYSWLDNKLDCPYNGDVALLLDHILNLGMGEVITRIQFPDDLKEYK